MKKKFTLALLAGAAILSASAQSKLDPAGRFIMMQYESLQLDPNATIPTNSTRFSVETLSRANSRVSIMIELSEGASAADLQARGFDINVDLGNIVVAEGTFEDIKALEDCDFVVRMSFGNENRAMLDVARESIGVDVIHAGGDGLSKAYTGKGVYAGLFDTGLDANHANFLNEDDRTTRIEALWHFTGGNGKSTVYDTPEKIAGFTTDDRAGLHATHTLGCMAGSFNGEGSSVAIVNKETGKAKISKEANPYYGIATGSDILVGCGTLHDDNILAAVSNIVDYAKLKGKPVAINLSIGHMIGPHDGTEMVTAGLDKLAKDAIICISSGNDGARGITIDKTFTSSDNSVKTFITTSSNSNFNGMLDIWSDTSEGFTITPFIYNTTTDAFVWEYKIESTNKKDIYIATNDLTASDYRHFPEFDQAFTSQSYLAILPNFEKAGNGRFNCYFSFDIKYNTKTNKSKNLVFGIKIEGKDGQRLMANCNSNDYAHNIQLSSLDKDGFTSGSSDFSASSMACGKNTISVGSYNSRPQWPVILNKMAADFDGYDVNKDDVSEFSSYAKLYDGRTVPFVCGPGCAVVSSVSSYSAAGYMSAEQKFNGRTNHWQAQQGTSMSSPIVAGSICLWLEADPTLTVEQVKDIIKNHASKPGNPAANPIQWGHGKFDALAGLKYVINNAGVQGIKIEDVDRFVLTPRGENNWEIFVPNAPEVSAAIYTTAGQLVKTVATEGSELTFSTDDLNKGIYIVNINGHMSSRIAVR